MRDGRWDVGIEVENGDRLKWQAVIRNKVVWNKSNWNAPRKSLRIGAGIDLRGHRRCQQSGSPDSLRLSAISTYTVSSYFRGHKCR